MPNRGSHRAPPGQSPNGGCRTRDPWSPTSEHLSQVFGRRSVEGARSTSAGRVLTSHFGWHDWPHTSAGLWRSGWRWSADLDHGSLREPALSSIVSAIYAGQPRGLAVRGGASLVLQPHFVGRPGWRLGLVLIWERLDW